MQNLYLVLASVNKHIRHGPQITLVISLCEQFAPPPVTPKRTAYPRTRLHFWCKNEAAHRDLAVLKSTQLLANQGDFESLG